MITAVVNCPDMPGSVGPLWLKVVTSDRCHKTVSIDVVDSCPIVPDRQNVTMECKESDRVTWYFQLQLVDGTGEGLYLGCDPADVDHLYFRGVINDSYSRALAAVLTYSERFWRQETAAGTGDDARYPDGSPVELDTEPAPVCRQCCDNPVDSEGDICDDCTRREKRDVQESFQ